MYRNKREFTVVSASAPQPASNVWVCPGGITRVRLVMYGGGGGGGGGAGGTNQVGWFTCGGGGGAAALQTEIELAVTPGTIYEAVVGAGGPGGLGGTKGTGFGGTSGANGTVGGNSIWRVQAGSTLFTAPGGQYGSGGGITNSSSFYLIAMGGGPPGRDGNRRYIISVTDQVFGINNSRMLHFDNVPGSGGPGMSVHGDSSTALNNTSPHTLRNGVVSTQGYAGGNGGVQGYDDGSGYIPAQQSAGSYQYGGPGGGGGGGPGGIGADGAAAAIGGLPNGGTAGANTGGGGGGGAGGSGDVSPNHSDGAPGGSGGSGKIILYW